MTWPQIEQQAQHFATLAQKPGWFQYCKHQIIEMESRQDSPWQGLRKQWGALLTKAGFTIPDNEQDGWWEVKSQHQLEMERRKPSLYRGHQRD